MTEQSQTGNSSQAKPRRTKEVVRHVHLERTRPKLSNYDEQDNARKAKKAQNRRSRAQSASRGKKASASPARRDSRAKLRIIPLGGLDAIGKNMTAFECGNDMVLDDAGLMFPDDNHPGIDLILPDYSYVLENAEKLRGIIITHGHEDHTGALPYLLKDLDRKVPIYATKLTLGLIEGKLAEHKIKNAKLCEIKPGQSIKLGSITAEFFSVNHSIPDAVGVFFQSPAGNVLHTGDFKLDQSPIDGVHTDFGALARFSKIGVDLMMSDSTNASNPNFTPSEAEVGKALDTIISQATGRVIVASFASHIHRMQQICDAAVRNGRKVAVTGRSMVQNTDIARRLGYLNIADKNLIDAYNHSKDIHAATASLVFHVPLEEVTKEQRSNAKAVNFGIVYGISSFGLSNDLSISRKEAEQYIKDYFISYPGIKNYLDNSVKEAKEKGYSVTMFGRRRPIPELTSGNFMQRQFGERVAMNSPIQGSAADIMKIAMINVAKELKEKDLKSKIVLQVHDELLIEAYENEVEQVKDILKRNMEQAAHLNVPLDVDVQVGNNWDEAH